MIIGWGSKPKPAELLKPLDFKSLTSVTAISGASRTIVQLARIDQLARHHAISVMSFSMTVS
jgi:hypothetical protein